MDKGEKRFYAMVLLIVLVFGSLFYFIASSNSAFQKSIIDQAGKQGVNLGSPGAGNTPSSGTNKCPSTSVTGSSAARNFENVSQFYQGTTIYYVGTNDVILASDTLNGGSTLSYKSTTIPCTPDSYNGPITVYAVASSTANSGTAGPLYFANSNSLPTTVISQTSASALEGGMLNSQLGNTSQTKNALAYSSGVNGARDKVNETGSTAIALGSSRSGYIEFWVSSGSTVFGGPKAGAGVQITISVQNKSVFTANALSLTNNQGASDLTEVTSTNPYPRVTALRSGDREYIMSAPKASGGVYRLAYTLRNDAGTQSSTASNPIIYIDALNYFLDTTGKIAYDGFDGANNVVGISGIRYTFSNA